VTAQGRGPHREGDEPKPMMNASEKSDLSVVAMKSANNVVISAAESMEPRGKAKENALQRTTCQTQGWDHVSPGLNRIRKIATAKPKERFTALLHHITPALLTASYRALKRNAAPGIDGLTRAGVRERPRG